MPITPRPVIALAAQDKAGFMVVEMARDVGRAVMAKGFHLLCAGTGEVLKAACEGAQEEKANLRRRGRIIGDPPMVIGLLSSMRKQDGCGELDLVLPTGMGLARSTLICSAADALIALEGGAGTLGDVAQAWQYGKPIILMAPNGSVLENLVGEKLDTNRDDMILSAETADRALEILAERIAQAASGAPKPKR
ncbi:MAG: hypothetical protein AB2A00_29365 [Myxococcota bacterium]